MLTNVVFSCTLALALSIAIAAAYRAVIRLSPLDQPLPLILPPPRKQVGPFSPNSLLHHVRRIGDGQLPKPEDVAVDGEGLLYVGCEDGWIRRVDRTSGKVEDWVQIEGGRPLGLAMGRHGELIVCEPAMGLLNVTRGKVEVLSGEAEGVKFKLTDAVAVALEDGSIFFTDATHKYPFSVHILDLLEARPNGRLLKYDPAARTTSVLMDQLYFPNGVALSRNEDFLVVCETIMARCQRYWLKGEKAGRAEIFIENLPAFPDNIKNDGKGRFWIALVSARPPYLNMVLKYPFVKHLQMVLGLSKHLLKLNKRALVLSVTEEEGIPLSTFADPTGLAIELVTTAFVIGDDMYLGNLGVDFLGHLKLN